MVERSYSIKDHEKIQLAGPGEQNFVKIEDAFDVRCITSKPGLIIQSENQKKLKRAENVLSHMRKTIKTGRELSTNLVNQMISINQNEDENNEGQNAFEDYLQNPILLDKYGKPVHPRTFGQASLIESVEKNDVTLVSGPAGTGKTFLTVSLAVAYFLQNKVERIVLVRPAVESGENLGFLPGDLKEKIAPYMTPLYDALRVLLPHEKLQELKEKESIEIAPLAYMRGRTLDNCFLILDEAQNTTIAQMKMFLTRLGMGGKIIVTGDETQKDLPVSQTSGLIHAKKILKGIQKVGQVNLTIKDVVRNPIVKDIIKAYENSRNRKK